MFTVDEKNNIKLTRGDSATFELTVKDGDDNTYDFSGDVVKFGVKRSALDTGEALLQKTFDENGKIAFTPEDTAKMAYGDYIYNVTIYHENEAEPEEEPTVDVYTVICANFSLMWNVL